MSHSLETTQWPLRPKRVNPYTATVQPSFRRGMKFDFVLSLTLSVGVTIDCVASHHTIATTTSRYSDEESEASGSLSVSSKTTSTSGSQTFRVGSNWPRIVILPRRESGKASQMTRLSSLLTVPRDSRDSIKKEVPEETRNSRLTSMSLSANNVSTIGWHPKRHVAFCTLT